MCEAAHISKSSLGGADASSAATPAPKPQGVKVWSSSALVCQAFLYGAPSSFLFLVVRPGAPSSVLAPICIYLHPFVSCI